ARASPARSWRSRLTWSGCRSVARPWKIFWQTSSTRWAERRRNCWAPPKLERGLAMSNESVSWVGATAKEIARAVRRGDTSATQVVADHLDYIRANDGTLNAFRLVRAGEALARSE